jgi:queuine/archaeosine tRNA-ribosyltransferase
MEDIRAAITQDRFPSLKDDFLRSYKPTDEAARLSQKGAWMEARGIRG